MVGDEHASHLSIKKPGNVRQQWKRAELFF